jgi:chromate transporter
VSGESPERGGNDGDSPERDGHGAESPERDSHLGEVAVSFLRLGTIAFGGPAAHLALMRSELVERRGWVEEQEFLDLVGGASLLPGPTSTEVAIMLAKRRAGWPGLVVGGSAFILPAMAIVLGLSWAYVRYGTTGPGEAIVSGVVPVVLAIVVDAIVGLGRRALHSVLLVAIAAAGLAGYFLGGSPLVILLAGLATALVAHEVRQRFGCSGVQVAPGVVAILVEFLKLGSVVFGSGYVLFSYLRGDLVRTHHWLTLRQLLATVAIGQLTPGPVFTTATSIGYVLGGLPGGLVATAGIFLPSFVFVAALLPVLARVRGTDRGRAALDGINAAAIALMAGVTIQLGHGSLVDWLTWSEAAVALVVLVRWRVNSTWLILGGIVVGVIRAVA